LIAFSTSDGSIIGGERLGKKLGGHINAEVEPRAHPHLQHVQVRGNELDLLPDGRSVFAHLRQRRAQILDQVADHRIGGRRIGFGQRLDIGQRVVKEVWLDLRLQRLQSRFGDLAVDVADHRLLLLLLGERERAPRAADEVLGDHQHDEDRDEQQDHRGPDADTPYVARNLRADVVPHVPAATDPWWPPSTGRNQS
jgi:hypothetical protein